MTIFNRAWLKDAVESYLHDSSVDSEADLWIDVGAKRVSQVLRAFEMAAYAEIVPLFPGAVTLPADFVQLLDVAAETPDGSTCVLSSMPAGYKERVGNNGAPQFYSMQGSGGLSVYPNTMVEKVQISYLAQVVVPEDDSETLALTAYPHLFLSAALSEAYDWKQDQELQQRYYQKWVTEAQDITTRYMSERAGEVIAIRSDTACP